MFEFDFLCFFFFQISTVVEAAEDLISFTDLLVYLISTPLKIVDGFECGFLINFSVSTLLGALAQAIVLI